MIKSKQKVSDLALRLKNNNALSVVESIDMLRETDSFEGAIGLLVDHYENCTDQSVRLSISIFLNDIKDNGAKGEIIDAINSAVKEDTRSMVITSCWQSGLDYSDKLDEFVSFFMKGSYSLAFECLTVIEQSVESINPLKRKDTADVLLNGLSSQPEEKKALVNELINILNDNCQSD